MSKADLTDLENAPSFTSFVQFVELFCDILLQSLDHILNV